MENNELSKSDAVLLARIDERTGSLVSTVNEIKSSLENKYLLRSEFAPVRNIVYGLVTVILLAVIGALVALVVK